MPFFEFSAQFKSVFCTKDVKVRNKNQLERNKQKDRQNRRKEKSNRDKKRDVTSVLVVVVYMIPWSHSTQVFNNTNSLRRLRR